MNLCLKGPKLKKKYKFIETKNKQNILYDQNLKKYKFIRIKIKKINLKRLKMKKKC